MKKFLLLLCCIAFISCVKPSEVNFEVSGFSDVGEITNFQNLSVNCRNYLWDFGDGSPASTDENPEHIYARPGNFTIRLDASGNQGKTSISKGIEVIGTSYSFKNDMSFDLERFATFSSGEHSLVNFIEHGTLLSDHETDTVYTGQIEVLFWYRFDDNLRFGTVHYALLKGTHNIFTINDQTPFNGI